MKDFLIGAGFYFMREIIFFGIGIGLSIYGKFRKLKGVI